jgi:hypothetical protein
LLAILIGLVILYGDPKNRRVNYIVVCPFSGLFY